MYLLTYLGTITCFITFKFLDVKADTNIITSPGSTVILPCWDHRYVPIYSLRWKKVGVCPYEQFFDVSCSCDQKNCSCNARWEAGFNGKVELRNMQMTGGEFSIVLKKTNIKDSGIYICIVEKYGDDKLNLDTFRHTINLTVRDNPIPTNASVIVTGTEKPKTHIAICIIATCIALCIILLIVYVKKKQDKKFIYIQPTPPELTQFSNIVEFPSRK